MRYWLERYFGFSRRERNGIAVLLVLIAVLVFVPFFHRLYVLRNAALDATEARQVMQLISAAKEQGLGVAHTGNDTKLAFTPNYFPFDPNSLSAEQGHMLGLTDRQISMIHNYLAKGGRFAQRADFKKIYAISDADYERLKDYISIPGIGENKGTANSHEVGVPRMDYMPKESSSSKTVAKALSVDLNRADSAQLTHLRGIGPAFAGRIVRYRNALGGFHDKAQLLEVYGMDSLRYAGLTGQLAALGNDIRKININTADDVLLRGHPYISGKQANLIVQYRKQHGDYASLSDLLAIDVFDDAFLSRISPYLTIDDD